MSQKLGYYDGHIEVWLLTTMLKHSGENSIIGENTPSGTRAVFDESVFNELTDEKAYILGLIFADGWFGGSGGHYKLGLKSIDKELVELFHRTVAPGYALQHKLEKRGGPSYEVRITRCGKMAESLFNHGFAPNGRMKYATPRIPPSLRPSFIRGFFDGDGCVYINRQLGGRYLYLHAYFCGYAGILSWIRGYLAFRGIQTSFRRKFITTDGDDFFGLHLAHNSSVALYHLMYDSGGPCLERKRQVFEKFIQPAQ